MEQVDNTVTNLEEKLIKLIKLLFVVKKVSNIIIDNEVNDIFLD